MQKEGNCVWIKVFNDRAIQIDHFPKERNDVCTLEPKTTGGIKQKLVNDYFVLGTNYFHSTDSRDFGSVSSKNILGKVLFKI